MSFNVENLFVRCDDQASVAEVVDRYWRSPSQAAQLDWGLPASFEALLAGEPRRKVAISRSRDGWVALVESKEVVDFSLARLLSEELDTAVLAIQLSETSGAAGYAYAVGGRVRESQFSYQDSEPLSSVRRALGRYNVPFDVTMFREAVQTFSEGWRVIQKGGSQRERS